MWDGFLMIMIDYGVSFYVYFLGMVKYGLFDVIVCFLCYERVVEVVFYYCYWVFENN